MPTTQTPSSFADDTPRAGLYIHIPFCLKKCAYCDFYSVTDLSLQSLFLEALISEMHLRKKTGLAFDTLYIGGGTPSVLDNRVLDKIVDSARQCFDISSDAEITLEVNPGTVTSAKLKHFHLIGVNRLNIGIQSFNPEHLGFLGRIHSDRDAKNAVRWARNAGFENIGLDLIYGIPGQTRTSWLKNLQRAVEFQPQHLSCYMLSYEPGTPLYNDLQKKMFTPLSEQQVCELYETTVAFLQDRRFVQYEISNFARNAADSTNRESAPTHASRHNMKYWNFIPYIGLGPSAHSFIDEKRFWNHSSVNKYIEELAAGRLPQAGKESLNREQQWTEAVYLGLRQTKGINIHAVEKKFNVNFTATYAGVIADLEEKGMLKVFPNRCALTTKGMMLLDSIATQFI